MEPFETCRETRVHEDNVARAQAAMPSEESLMALADVYKVFGDTTRVRILFALLQSEECVCDIARLLEMTPSAISHQLRVLKQARLIRARRDGKTVYYALADAHVEKILGQGMEHVCEQE